jgi:hypothetical protein
MDLVIKINMDNEAFEENPEAELQYLLETVGISITDGDVFGKIVDTNGNTCGHFEMKGG